jgi:hypothetical protein
LPSELHFGHPVGGHEQIVYNQNNGHLYNDYFSTTLGHEVHELFAVLDTTGLGALHPHHPALTASDFLVT